jgi:hypothetical protein
MKDVELNPTVERYRGSIGRLVFKKYRGKTIVAKKPVRTKAPGEAELARRERFKEGVAYAKGVLADPVASAFYEPIAERQELSVYVVAMRDFLKRPKIKPLYLSKYKGQIGNVIEIRATDDIGLADLDVNIVAQDGSPIERGKAVETATGSGKWIYTATASVAYGSDVFIEVLGVDHAGNETKLTENPTVGEDE